MGHWGGLRGGNKGKGFRAGQGELLEVWNRVKGGRASASFKFTTVYFIERTKHIRCHLYISQIVMFVAGV